MGLTTKISWCDSTANPVMGCDGCELHRAGEKESHCYAAGLVGRYAGLPGWPVSFDIPQLINAEERIQKALAWPDLTGKERLGTKHSDPKPWLNGYPRTIFLGDLADVFSESLPLDWLAQYLPAMAASPHVWILCTKRPKRMAQFFDRHLCPPNFWLLTTVTSAATIGRIADLVQIEGATVRGLSVEPMLGPIDISRFLPALRWVICGGESGPGARPMPSHWAFDLRDQCIAANVPFFFKQWSEWIDAGCGAFGRAHYGPPRHVRSDGTFWPIGQVPADEDADVLTVVRAGVTTAGTELGGREWHEMPEVRRW